MAAHCPQRDIDPEVVGRPVVKSQKIAHIGPDLPDFDKLLIDAPIFKPLNAKGIQTTMVPYPLTATDMSPYVKQASDWGATAIQLAASVANCTSGIKAHYQLAPKIPLVVATTCADPTALRQDGAAAEGVYYPSDYFSVESDNAQVKTFLSAWKKYGNGHAANSRSHLGFAVGPDRLLWDWRAMEEGPP